MSTEPAITITLKEIYDELKKSRIQNTEDHKEIIHRLDQTNGRVKLNRWIASTALAISLLLIGLFVKM